MIKDKCEKHSITSGVAEIDRFLYGMVTGTCILSITNPVWVTKTRLCLQYENEGTQYRGMTDCMRSIVRHEGFRSLYKVKFIIIARNFQLFPKVCVKCVEIL